MSFDVKKTIRSYITYFPGSFVGFFDVLSEILENIGDEWDQAGKKPWANVFKKIIRKYEKYSQ